jgi:hypothetical protein
MIGTVLVAWHWWQVANFEYAGPAFRRRAFVLFPLIPITVFGVSALLEWFSRLRRRSMIARGAA